MGGQVRGVLALYTSGTAHLSWRIPRRQCTGQHTPVVTPSLLVNRRHGSADSRAYNAVAFWHRTVSPRRRHRAAWSSSMARKGSACGKATPTSWQPARGCAPRRLGPKPWPGPAAEGASDDAHTQCRGGRALSPCCFQPPVFPCLLPRVSDRFGDSLLLLLVLQQMTEQLAQDALPLRRREALGCGGGQGISWVWHEAEQQSRVPPHPGQSVSEFGTTVTCFPTNHLAQSKANLACRRMHGRRSSQLT